MAALVSNTKALNAEPVSILDQLEWGRAEAASRYKPVMTIDEMVEREKSVQYLVDNIMGEGVDWGWVPGTKPTSEAKPGEYKAKPTLFKAGAERACNFFGYVPHFTVDVIIEEWNPGKYGEMLFYYSYTCTLLKDGKPVGEGKGSASTWESKYRYRNAERVCPGCGKANIRKSKPKQGQRGEPGFYCWEKTGGCGATFEANDQEILGQETGKTANPDVADVVNTVQKMGQKRAYVAATLTATGLSGRFTQDLEDLPAPPQQERHEKGQPTPAQQAVADRKIEELRQRQPQAQPKTELTEQLVDSILASFSMAQGEKSRQPSFERIQVAYREIRAKLEQVAAGAYSRILNAHGMQTSEDVKNPTQAKECFRELWAEYRAASSAPPIDEFEQHMQEVSQ